MITLLIATYNKGKLREIKKLLREMTEVRIIALDDINPHPQEVIEDGASFKENAIKKAQQIAARTHCITIADDSGLCVDYLNGQPGVLSARYAGEDKNDRKNRKKVLDLMRNIPAEQRQAYFICAIALVSSENILGVVEGRCEGVITTKEKGRHGFGYDSIFYYPPLNKTFAELTVNEKNKCSHRGRALVKLRELLHKYILDIEIT